MKCKLLGVAHTLKASLPSTDAPSPRGLAHATAFPCATICCSRTYQHFQLLLEQPLDLNPVSHLYMSLVVYMCLFNWIEFSKCRESFIHLCINGA